MTRSSEEHLQGEQYRAVSACPDRHGWDRDRVAGRRGRAGRNRASVGAGPGALAGVAAVAQARHDPGKIVVDLALSLAVGGDCLADVAVLRDQPGVFGRVASDPTVSRLVDTLAADATRALAAIDAARAAARARVWSLAGEHGPNHANSVDDPTIVDLDATLLTAHSEKEQAAPTFKRGFGFHPVRCEALSIRAEV